MRLEGDALSRDLALLDAMSLRTADSVHVCLVKAGQCRVEEILANTAPGVPLDFFFCDFLHSLGWTVDVRSHPGWTGDPATSWKPPSEVASVVEDTPGACLLWWKMAWMDDVVVMAW